MNVCFRADASAEIGTGHIMRCLTLARVLKAHGCQCRFLTADASLRVVPVLQNGEFPVTVTAGDDVAFTAGDPAGCDWLVVDHYGLDASFESACRPWAGKILVIDDLADRPHDCDLLLDQTLGRQAQDYAGRVPERAALLLGAQFALLRDQFAQARAGALARRQQGGPVERILVSLGGVAQVDLLAVVLEGLAASGPHVRIDVITGMSASGVEDLQARMPVMPQSVTVLDSVDDMAERMAAADLAVGAAGTTSWERCCLGLPSLMVVLADNQSLIAQNLDEAGAAVTLGWWRDLTAGHVAEKVTSICADDARRARMSDNAARICDGRGAQRVYEQMKVLT